MNIDPNGNFFWLIFIGAVVGATSSMTGSIVTQLVTTGKVDWGKVLIAGAFGALGGALAITGVGGVFGQFLIQGGLSVAETATNASIDGTLNELSFGELFGDFILGGALGMIGAKSANRNFKRFLQIEKSLVKVFKREIKKGIKAGFSVLITKGKKFFVEFVKPTFKSGFTSDILAGIVEALRFK